MKYNLTKLPQIQFGTDGWRAIDEKEINPDTVSYVAAAFAMYLYKTTEAPSCIVGYDGRKNSYKYAKIFTQVLLTEGIDAFLSEHITPTPFVSYYVKKHALTAGVMITASHNPAEYNGIKFKGAYGGPFMTEETLKVEQQLGVDFSLASFLAKKDIREDYFQHIEDTIDFKSIRDANIKPLIDSMGGAGLDYIEDILRKNGIEATSIYSKATPDFSGRYAEPIEKNLQPLSKFLKEDNTYCCGFGTDGDADRLGVLMENGEWLSAQETILYLNDYVINDRKEKGSIIKTSSVTDKIKLLESKKHPLYEVQVGFKYICEQMLKTRVAIGCEESGGFGYGFHLPERDGIFSALLFLEMLAKSEYKKLSEFVKAKKLEFGQIYYDRVDYHFDRSDRTMVLPLLYEKGLNKLAGYNVLNIESFNSSRGIINGLKFRLEGKCRWLLLRASETEPLMRIYAEGQNHDEVKIIINEGKRIITN